jgi:hypothetical protein
MPDCEKMRTMTTPRFHFGSKCSGRLVAPISAVALLIVLCLTFTPVSSAATSPQAQVRAAWTKFKNAIADKDPSAFCGSLTAKASRQFVADVPKKQGATSCKEAAVDLFKVAGGSSVAGVKLLTVRVSGNTATTTDTAGPPAAHWVRTGPSTWKIASLPSNL